MTETMMKTETPQGQNAESTRSGATFCPRFDIWESEDELVLYGDLPGVQPDDLEVRFENRELTIWGRVEPRPIGENGRLLHSEYGLGDFHRSFTVGEAIDTDNISADLKHGVLTLHLPKTEKVKPRRIEVRAG